jgi:glucosyl-dolichyl phosphate glucuronosyltransferase
MGTIVETAETPIDLISVVICAYTQERWDRLFKAVASIREQTHPNKEIVVVIDHNQELFKRAERELIDVCVIENTERQGLSGGRNSGIAVAHGAFLAFLDDDAVAAPDWLASMYTALADPDILGVGSKVLPDWEDREPSWLPMEFYWVVGCSYRGLPHTTAPIRNPFGGCMCVRKEIFDAVGSFRSEIGRVGTLPVGCEETELCIRAHQYWPKRYFLYLPHTSISHFVPQSRLTWKYFRSRCYSEGISKAVVGRFVGTKDALSTESTYTLRTLPSGILLNLGLTLVKLRFSYTLRAFGIVVGLSATVVGYLVGKHTALSAVENTKVPSEATGSYDKQKVVL